MVVTVMLQPTNHFLFFSAGIIMSWYSLFIHKKINFVYVHLSIKWY